MGEGRLQADAAFRAHLEVLRRLVMVEDLVDPRTVEEAYTDVEAVVGRLYGDHGIDGLVLLVYQLGLNLAEKTTEVAGQLDRTLGQQLAVEAATSIALVDAEG